MVRVLVLVAVLCAGAMGQVRHLDGMDAAAGWKVITSEDVSLDVRPEAQGGCLRLEYHFKSGAGYGIIQKPFDVQVPDNYEFSFRLRGEGPANNLEFKLLDESGESVWWHIRRAYDWPRDWTRLVSTKRDIEFAWGPAAGAPLTRVAKIEFAISSSEGGRGTVWLDELTFRALPPARETPAPLRPAPGQVVGAAWAVDGDSGTAWATPGPGALTLDQGESAEFGGVQIAWGSEPRMFSIDCSDDGESWSAIVGERPPGVMATVAATPNAQARYIRLRVDPKGGGAEVREVRLLPAAYSATPNAVVQATARERARGLLPRQFLGEQSYWTVIGADGGTAEALVGEDGAVEVGKRGFSLEPAVRIGGRVFTWADVGIEHSLAQGSLPVPKVAWKGEGFSLTIEPFVAGDAAESAVYVMYELRRDEGEGDAELHIGVRPFQVNPLSQRLNFEGGVSAIRELVADSGGVLVNGSARVTALTAPVRTGATTWGEGEAFEWLSAGREMPLRSAACPDGLASGVMTYAARLGPGGVLRAVVGAPLEGRPVIEPRADSWEHAARLRGDVVRAWDARLSRAAVVVPRQDAWVAESFRAQLGYILVNRDGPAVQPGSRSYERSWARDGSLTSAALVACGYAEEARAWVDWYGQHLFESGKVPCVVDRRGPDPVPEHDSHGQYIWAVANYYRHTRDRAFLETHWPRVQRVAAYIRSLRAERMTDEYRADTFPQAACYGLVPESISHEGYSAKPMHSYWDDFFVLLGLREAAWLAGQVHGEGSAAARELRDEHDDFQACLRQSIERAQAHHAIDYIPGCVELGDFDATSTTVALFPCHAEGALPPAGFGTTFERYWEFARGRMRGGAWDAYTPYEWRTVGAFVRLGERERAYTLLQWLGTHQRPAGWRHWAEVVGREERTARFLGDMPHTWVGSDFLNSVMSMFICERDGALVAFAGVPREWVDSGEPVGFTGLVTPHATLSGTMQRTGGVVRVMVEGTGLPEGGLVIAAPPGAVGGDVTVTELPARAEFKLRSGDVP